MASRGASVFPLVDCHPSILQRIIGLCDKEGLFLLRLVARRFRDAVGQRVKRLCPREPSGNLAAKFPNLVSLDLSRTYHWGIAAEELAPLLPQLPHLRELRLQPPTSADLTDEWLPALSTLTRLHLDSVNDAEGFLSVAAHCSSLQRLEVSGICENLTWEILYQALARMADTLVRLEVPPVGEDLLMGGGAPAEGLLPLNTGKLQSLRVDCQSMPNDVDVCSQLRGFTSLTALDVFCGRITDEGIAQLCALTQLTSLRLDTGGYSCAGVSQLSQLPRLADLCVSHIGGEFGLQGGAADALPLGKALAGLEGLRQLEVLGCTGVKRGRIKGAYSRLTKLRMNNTGLRDEPRCLQPLTGLRDLMIFQGLRNETQLCYLSGMLHLTRLDLSHGALAMSATGAGWLARLTALRLLSLAGNFSITGDALDQLAGMPALHALDLSFEPRWQEKLPPLPPLAPLERLLLGWLRLPAHIQSAEELPERLRVPFLKGQRRPFHSLS